MLKLSDHKNKTQWVSRLIIAIIIVLMVIYLYVNRRIQTQYETTMNYAVENMTSRVVGEVDNYFSPVFVVDALLNRYWNVNNDFVSEGLRVEAFARSLVGLYPQIDALYFGDVDGEFIMFIQDTDGEVHTKVVINDNGSQTTRWRYFEGPVMVEDVVVDAPNFDPRTRPWFIDAQATEKMVVSEPYVFFTSQEEGISFARQMKKGDAFWGSYGIDVSLTALKSDLSAIDLFGHGKVFIATDKGAIITPDDTLTFAWVKQSVFQHLESNDDKSITNLPSGQTLSLKTSMNQLYNPLTIGTLMDHSRFLNEVNISRFLLITVNVLLMVLVLAYSYNKRAMNQSKLEWEKIATVDRLTGLKNRHSFDDRFEMLRRTEGKVFSVVMGDIDHFKRINDTYGHGVGDEVLVGISKIMKMYLRQTDEAYRWGGEEFLWIVDHVDDFHALEVAERVRKAIESTLFNAGGVQIACTMSFGIATYVQGMEKNDLIKLADDRLYEAKKTGRNRSVASG